MIWKYVKNKFDLLETEMNRRFELVDARIEKIEFKMKDGFDTMLFRFDSMEEKVNNLVIESRSYFKRLEERADTHEIVIRKPTYLVNTSG